jgi:hypothetical protein
MQEILGSLVEPIDTYQKLYTNDSADSFTKCSNFMNKFKELQKRQQEARDRYFYMKEKAHQQDLQIEEAMQAHDRGDISHNKVTRINKNSITVKYKAEVACQSFKHAIESTNQQVKAIETQFMPNMKKLQDIEQGRIEFIKSILDRISR